MADQELSAAIDLKSVTVGNWPAAAGRGSSNGNLFPSKHETVRIELSSLAIGKSSAKLYNTDEIILIFQKTPKKSYRKCLMILL
jgi:hypothetical protein